MESGQSWAGLSSAVVPVASKPWGLGVVDSDHKTESSHHCCSSTWCRNVGQAVWGPGGAGRLLCVLHYHQSHLHLLQLWHLPLLLEPQGNTINKPDNHSYKPHAGWEQRDSPPSPKALSHCHCHRVHTLLPPAPLFAGHARLRALPHPLDPPPSLLACLLLARQQPSCPHPVKYKGALATCV